MSTLVVPSNLVERVKKGAELGNDEFGAIIRESLPVAYDIAAQVGFENERRGGRVSIYPEAVGHLMPEEYGQVLRAMASTSIRRFLSGIAGAELVMVDEKSIQLRELRPFDDPPTKRERRIAHEREIEENYERLLRKFPLGMNHLQELVLMIRGSKSGFADLAPRSMEKERRNQVLKLMAIEPYRRTIEIFWGVTLAFQNCHRVGGGKDPHDELFQEFTSVSAQILNQATDTTDG